ncbi:hypothetical protein ACJX0J_007184, partial [Zea mays]
LEALLIHQRKESWTRYQGLGRLKIIKCFSDKDSSLINIILSREKIHDQINNDISQKGVNSSRCYGIVAQYGPSIGMFKQQHRGPYWVSWNYKLGRPIGVSRKEEGVHIHVLWTMLDLMIGYYDDDDHMVDLGFRKEQFSARVTKCVDVIIAVIVGATCTGYLYAFISIGKNLTCIFF